MYTIIREYDNKIAYYRYCDMFAENTWPGDGQKHWIAKSEAGRIVGFCSVIHWEDIRTVFLSSCGVIEEARGANLQQRMIDVRVHWAKEQRALWCVTYVAADNYASLFNLLKQGFHAEWMPFKRWHVLYRPLNGVDAQMDKSFLKTIKRRFGLIS